MSSPALTGALAFFFAGEIALERMSFTAANCFAASVAFPAWVLGHHPSRELLCVSYAQDLAEGVAWSGLDLQRALLKRSDILRAVQAWCRDCDFVVSPLASGGALAAEHGVLDPIEIVGERVGDMRRQGPDTRLR